MTKLINFSIFLINFFFCFDSFGMFRQDLNYLIQEIKKSEIVLIGEEHQNPQHAKMFISLLERLEKTYPDLINVIGLEIFDIYQSNIDRYLASGNENYLIETPDSEAIRGHRKNEQIKENFLEIFRHIFKINSRRSIENKIKVVAVDNKPDPNMTWRDWVQKHSLEDLIRWGATRDENMFDLFKPVLHSLRQSKKLAIIFIGSGHIQKSGSIKLENGINIKWLGTRLREEFSNILSVNQNDPSNDCIDLFEIKLKQKNNILLNLQNSSWGNLKNFRCKNEFPISYEFLPENYLAKDHYDFYWYYSHR